MARVAPLIVAFLVLASSNTGRAQFQADHCGTSSENPLGLAMGIGVAVALGLAAPVLLSEGSLPRPGTSNWQVGLGYQSEPHSLVVLSSAGGYYRGAPWLGLEGRANSRAACTVLDFMVDASYFILLRPTPASWPVWLEILIGPSLETAFGGYTVPYITGGPSAGLRAGVTIGLTRSARLALEAESLYNARFGTGFTGLRHQLEIAVRAAFLFRDDRSDWEGGFALEVRHERAVDHEPTLPETHQVTLSGLIHFGGPPAGSGAGSRTPREPWDRAD